MTETFEAARPAHGAGSKPPLLAVRNIEVVYDDVILVLRGLSLEVPKGAIVALLGANGAGKSTTLKAISGLLKTEDGEVTRGEIVFDGDVITKLNGDRIRSLGDLREKLAAKTDNKPAELTVLRNKSEVTLTVDLPAPAQRTKRRIGRSTNI